MFDCLLYLGLFLIRDSQDPLHILTVTVRTDVDMIRHIRVEYTEGMVCDELYLSSVQCCHSKKSVRGCHPLEKLKKGFPAVEDQKSLASPL